MSEPLNEARQYLVGLIEVGTKAVKLTQEAKNFVIDRIINHELIERGLLDESERFNPVTPRAIADALSRKIFADYEIDVGDLLDAESVKRALKREALRVVGDRLGVSGGAKSIAGALRSRVRLELINAARSGETEILEAIAVGQRSIDDAQRSAEVNTESQSIRNFTQAGEKNRERQARYRASHQRVWVQK